MPFDHLFRQFGSDAEDSYFSFLEPQTCYNHQKRHYIINPAPWRFTEARFDPDIDKWLKLLGGEENYDLLCDWLAGVTRLDRPCAAIYLDGPPGCGKSLFAHGAAQIWTTRAPLYEEIVRNFNSGLMECPVILIDEGFLASDVKNPTMLMRRLVAQDNHSVNVKFGPQLKLRNHLRFVVAANNDSVFLTGKEERLSENDSRAMAERIAYVKVGEEATEFFVKNNRGNRLTNRWLGEEGRFAKHVLWLRDNRDLSNTGRFLVEGKNSEMHEQFLFQGNERNLVLEWIVRFCEAPAVLNARHTNGISAAEIGNGIVAINTKLMKDSWKTFCSDRDALDHSHLLRHIKSLSHQEKTVLVRVGDTTARYWAIPISRILVWVIIVYYVVAGVFEVDRDGLLASGAAVGVAIGFAAQDGLKNIIGGILIIMAQPFQVGDRVSVGGTYGEVVSIGLRSTRIVTPDDNLVSVPNTQVVDGQVANANAGALDCQVVTTLYLPGWVDVSRAKEIAYDAAANSKYVYLKKPIVVLIKDDFKETFLTKIIVKAYVLDARYEAAFSSDITETAKSQYLREGMLVDFVPGTYREVAGADGEEVAP
jgi:hypothetical protein